MAESTEDNFVFSPLSMHSALAMLFLGTTNNSTTEQELQKAMGGVSGKEAIKAGYNRIIGAYSNEDNFRYGNNLWVQNGFEVNDAFRKAVVDNLRSGVENINFSAKNSVESVNKWIATMTGNKIKKMVDSFSDETVLFIANAMYFKEDWLVPFEDIGEWPSDDYAWLLSDEYTTIVPEQEFKGEFQTNGGSKKVNMMQQDNSDASYREIELFSNISVEVISLPYKNDLFEMHLIVPKKGQMLELEKKMKLSNEQGLVPGQKSSFNLFSNIMNETHDKYPNRYELYLRLPTFQVRTDMDMKSLLKKLGVEKVFNRDAELSEIGNGNLLVSKAKHTALFEVTKEGAEGAAATVIQIEQMSLPLLVHL